MFSFENEIRGLQSSTLTLLYCKLNPAVCADFLIYCFAF